MRLVRIHAIAAVAFVWPVSLVQAGQAAPAERPLVDRLYGIVYKVDAGQKCFMYANSAGAVKVVWTDKTRFSLTETKRNLNDLPAEGRDARVQLGRTWKRELEKGRLTTRGVQIFNTVGKRKGALPSAKSLAVTGVLSKKGKGFEIQVGERTIKVVPARRRARFVYVSPADSTALAPLKTRARVAGKEKDGQVVADLVLVEPYDALAQDEPGLKRALILGDSISMGFHAPLVWALKGKVNVHRPEANCGPTTRGVQLVRHWLGPYWVEGLGWDVIQFNHGLHDLYQMGEAKEGEPKPACRVSIADYKQNLETIIAELKKTKAKLIWATTTPVPPGSRRREAGMAKVYNAAAMEVIKRHPEIAVNDLWQACQGHYPSKEWGGLDGNVHFQAPGREAQGRIVARFLLKTLGIDAELNPTAKK